MVRPGSGGLGWIQGGIAVDFPTYTAFPDPTRLVPLNYWDRGSSFFGGAYYGTLGSMAISIETLKKKSL